MDINTIRRLNLNVLLDSFDSQQDFAKAIDTTESYLSQMKRGKSRNIGDHIARKIETQLKKPRGWMDQPQGWTRELVTADIQLPLEQLDEEDIALLRSVAERLIASKQGGAHAQKQVDESGQKCGGGVMLQKFCNTLKSAGTNNHNPMNPPRP